MAPGFTASTANSLLMSPARFSRVAGDSGIAGINLDADSWTWRLVTRGLRSTADLTVPVKSITITPAQVVRWSRQRSQLNWLGGSNTRIQVNVRLEEFAGHGDDQLIALQASKFLDMFDCAGGAVLTVPARALDGGRAHLARLHALKRLAEEWDLAIGFELDKRTDARWEAEAAVQIAGSRLAYLGISARIHESSIRQSDVLVRVIRACADEDFHGTISLTSSQPLWSSWSSGAVTHDLLASRDFVTRVFHNRSLPAVIPNDTTIRHFL
jgi:hypothetical protein